MQISGLVRSRPSLHSKTYNNTHRATITKLPDSNPLYSWLVVIPLGQKVLVRQLGAGGDFHSFKPVLRCHNNFVLYQNSVKM